MRMNRDDFIDTLQEVSASVRLVERTQLGTLSVTEMLLLLHLQQEKAGIPQGALLKNESLPLAPGLSALLTRLERRGLVTRERDPRSRRNLLVALTPAGEKELGVALWEVESKFLPKLHAFVPQKALQDHLRKFRRSLFPPPRRASSSS